VSTQLELDGVWKSFPRWQAGTRSLRSLLDPALRAQRRSTEVRWALRDISFSLAAGEALGIVGHNGAGKSTLLRLASGISEPTRGAVRVATDSASVLSLGDTFNMELTGRENALTAALVHGMRVSDARRAMPAMLEFAELEEFADAPMRSYSDGMKLRLAFGVVAQLEPRLLILDEVLAVGDLSFQEKCMAWIRDLRENGTSLLFASHNLDQVVEECDRAMWIQQGRVLGLGDAEEIVDRYRGATQEATLMVTPAPDPARDGDDDDEDDGDGETEGLVLQETRFGSQEVLIEDVRIGAGGDGEADPEETLEVAFTVRANAAHDDLAVSLSIQRPEGEIVCLDVNTQADGIKVGPLAAGGTQRIVLAIDDLELAPGTYFVDIGVFPPDWAHSYDYHWRAHRLRVRGNRYTEFVYRPRLRRWNVGDAA
jgi:lipopolysaccharide transport system ATP-binding protein